jgi:hypothetical protein
MSFLEAQRVLPASKDGKATAAMTIKRKIPMEAQEVGQIR